MSQSLPLNKHSQVSNKHLAISPPSTGEGVYNGEAVDIFNAKIWDTKKSKFPDGDRGNGLAYFSKDRNRVYAETQKGNQVVNGVPPSPRLKALSEPPPYLPLNTLGQISSDFVKLFPPAVGTSTLHGETVDTFKASVWSSKQGGFPQDKSGNPIYGTAYLTKDKNRVSVSTHRNNWVVYNSPPSPRLKADSSLHGPFAALKQNISPQSESREEFFDAPQGWPVPNALKRAEEQRSDMDTLQTGFGQMTMRSPSSAHPSHAFGSPYADPMQASSALHSQTGYGSKKDRVKKFTKDPSGLSLPRFNQQESVNSGFTSMMINHFGAGLWEPKISSATGFSFAEQFINTRPAYEHVSLAQEMTNDLMQEVNKNIRSEGQSDSHEAAIDRAIRYLVEKDADAEPDDIGYREAMAKLVYFKNRVLDADVDLPQNVQPLQPGELNQGDRVLIDIMAGNG